MSIQNMMTTTEPMQIPPKFDVRAGLAPLQIPPMAELP